MKRAGSEQMKKVKEYYAGAKNCVQLPKTCHTQKFCWLTYVLSVFNCGYYLKFVVGRKEDLAYNSYLCPVSFYVYN